MRHRVVALLTMPLVAAILLSSCTYRRKYRECPHGEAEYELFVWVPYTLDSGRRIVWNSASFLPRDGKMKTLWPSTTIIRQRITDDLGNRYELGDVSVKQCLKGYILAFGIALPEKALNAQRIDIDMVVAADDMTFHIRNTVRRTDEDAPHRHWK